MQINLLPDVLRNMVAFKKLTAISDKQDDAINKSIVELKNNQYILETSEKGIARYEKMLGVIPLGSDTLEDRQFRILSMYNQKLPYTEKSIRAVLDTLVGANGYKAVLSHETRVLIVKLALSRKSMFNTVQRVLEECIPLDIAIEISLLYNQHQLLENFTYEQLERYTYEELREVQINE